MKKNYFDVIGMAWSDKISFDKIKKKLVFLKKKLLISWEKHLKKIVIFFGVSELEGD